MVTMINFSGESMAEVAGFLLIVGVILLGFCVTQMSFPCSGINISLNLAERWSFLNRDHESH